MVAIIELVLVAVVVVAGVGQIEPPEEDEVTVEVLETLFDLVVIVGRGTFDDIVGRVTFGVMTGIPEELVMKRVTVLTCNGQAGAGVVV